LDKKIYKGHAEELMKRGKTVIEIVYLKGIRNKEIEGI